MNPRLMPCAELRRRLALLNASALSPRSALERAQIVRELVLRNGRGR